MASGSLLADHQNPRWSSVLLNLQRTLRLTYFWIVVKRLEYEGETLWYDLKAALNSTVLRREQYCWEEPVSRLQEYDLSAPAVYYFWDQRSKSLMEFSEMLWIHKVENLCSNCSGLWLMDVCIISTAHCSNSASSCEWMDHRESKLFQHFLSLYPTSLCISERKWLGRGTLCSLYWRYLVSKIRYGLSGIQ